MLKAMGMNEAHLRQLKTDVYRNARMIRAGSGYPVIVYSPAFGVDRDMYLFNIAHYVRNGFIVITVGAAYESIFTIFPDGEFIPQKRELGELEGTDFVGWQTLLDVRTKDIASVLNILPELNENDETLQRSMNLRKIAAIGHSLGGAAVFRTMAGDVRVRAGILLDPSFHLVKPLCSVADPLETPVLAVRQEASTYEELKNAGMNLTIAEEYIKGQLFAYEYVKGYKSFVKLAGAHHMTFSDVPLLFAENDAARLHSIVNQPHSLNSLWTDRIRNTNGCFAMET